MRYVWPILLLLAGCTPAGSGSGLTGQEKQVVAVFKRVNPSVVRVFVPGRGLGSGVILDTKGDIVTNRHVVAGGRTYLVRLADGRSFKARLVGSDPADDLALLRIRAPGLRAIALGDSAHLQVGQTVLAVGNPLGLSGTVTGGLVSALNRTVQEPDQTYIPDAVQTSAPINPGNSGGALVDLTGRLVGIPTLTAIDPEIGGAAPGIGFAIPSATVGRIAAQLEHYGRVLHTGRAWLGVSLTPAYRQTAAGPVPGLLVVEAVSGGPAARAGLRPGMLLIAWNSRPVRTQGGLLRLLAAGRPGETISVTVLEPNGGRKALPLRLGEMPANLGA